MAIQKSFIVDEEVAAYLEEIAKERGKSITETLEAIIEENYAKLEKKKKLEALERVAGSASGVFGDLTIQEIKANMDV